MNGRNRLIQANVKWDLASARDVSPSRRRTVLAVLIGLGLALLWANYLSPNIQLRPLVSILLIAVTAYGGMRVGMTYAIIAAPAFTYVEALGLQAPTDYHVAINALLATVAFAMVPILVIYLQRRIRSALQSEARLRAQETLRRQGLETEAARSQLARVEANYRAVGESIPFGVWQTDADGNLLYVSESYRRVCGMTRDELTQGGWLKCVPEEDAKRFLERWQRRDQEPNDIWEGEYRLNGVDGRTYAILSRGVRLKDDNGATSGWAGVSLDITQRKRAIDAIALLEEAGRQLMLSLDPGAILERVMAACVPRFADWAAIDIVQEDGTLRSAGVRHADPKRLEIARELLGYPQNPNAPQGSYAVARTGKSELFTEIPTSLLEAGAQDPRHLDLLRALELKSAMIVPLIARERVIGTLTLVTAESGRRYDEEDLGVAEVLGVRIALAYQNSQHYAREVRVADTLQQASLPPDLPQLPGIRIHATYVPGATESEIGGDWYDAFLLPDGTIGITIGDVAGKGLRAAVAMGTVRQALRGAALDGLSPAAALTRVNRHLCHEQTGMVTAVAATIDPIANRITYSSAGHPPVIIASTNGDVHNLQTPGMPLGLFPETRYREEQHAITWGDLAVFYTDGLLENDRNITAGERRLAEAAAEAANVASPNPALSIQHRVITGRPKDDVAVLTVALLPLPIEKIDVEAPALPSSARVLRQALRRLAIELGMSEEAIFPLLVAAGEAISNAIEHAYGVGEGSVHVQAARRNGKLVVEVSDSGSWRLPRNDGRGRGLPLMRAIVDEVDVRAGESGTTVRLAVGLHKGAT